MRHHGFGNIRNHTPAVPIVGQPFEVFEFVPVVVMRCLCHPTNGPAVLSNAVQTIICHRCGRQYGIAGIRFDQKSGAQVALAVSQGAVPPASAPAPPDTTEPDSNEPDTPVQ